MEVVAWYSANATEPFTPPPAAAAFAAKCYMVAAVEVCGFGESGDGVGTGGFFAEGTKMRSEASENMAHEIERSVVRATNLPFRRTAQTDVCFY
jgi:hypothetical protein